MAFNFLIVDDSGIIRSMIARTVRISGVPLNQLFTAEHGAQALEVLRNNWVDMVFADLNMPVMDGVSMIEEMNDDAVLRNVPVVVVSTEGSQAKIEKLYQKGMVAFLRKPFTPEMIRDAIIRVLGEWDESENGNQDLPSDSF